MRRFLYVLVVVCSLICSFATAQVPQSNHIWLITEENHSYEEVIGNSSMPYFNGLASKYALATQYYSTQHNSLSALMWFVAGQMVTSDDQSQGCFDVDNVVREVLARNLTWKAYQEDLPYPGFQGLSYANYVRRHNPLIDFTDSCAQSQMYNSVPFSQLAQDIAQQQTPNYAYITPNLQHDAHDGTLAQADAWLSTVVPTLLALPEFQPGGDGLLFIVWDEGGLGDDNRWPRCNSDDRPPGEAGLPIDNAVHAPEPSCYRLRSDELPVVSHGGRGLRTDVRFLQHSLDCRAVCRRDRNFPGRNSSEHQQQ